MRSGEGVRTVDVDGELGGEKAEEGGDGDGDGDDDGEVSLQTWSMSAGVRAK